MFLAVNLIKFGILFEQLKTNTFMVVICLLIFTKQKEKNPFSKIKLIRFRAKSSKGKNHFYS